MENFNFTHELLAVQNDLFRYALKLAVNDYDADDLLQETILRALQNKDLYAMDTNFKGWLYAIMRNIFINDYLAKKRRGNLYILSDPTNTFDAKDNSHLAVVDNRFDSEEIQKAMKTLSEKNYITFHLYVSGFKYKEIADKTGEPLGTVKSRIFNSRRKLKKLLLDFI